VREERAKEEREKEKEGNFANMIALISV